MFNDPLGVYISTQCPRCGQDFQSPELLASHQGSLEHYLDGTCNLCNKDFSTIHSLRRHFKSVHLKAAFPCDLCGTTFNRFDSVKRHCIKIHQIYPCKHCKAMFPDQIALVEHSRVHSWICAFKSRISMEQLLIGLIVLKDIVLRYTRYTHVNIVKLCYASRVHMKIWML